MLIAIVVVCPLIILGILFYSRRPRFIRRVARHLINPAQWAGPGPNL